MRAGLGTWLGRLHLNRDGLWVVVVNVFILACYTVYVERIVFIQSVNQSPRGFFFSRSRVISHNHSTSKIPFPLAAAANSVHRTHSLPR